MLEPTGTMKMFAGSGFGETHEFESRAQLRRWLEESGTMQKMIEADTERRRAKYEQAKLRRREALAAQALASLDKSGDTMDAEDGDTARAFIAMNVPQEYSDVLRLSPGGGLENLAGMFGRR
jgi:hypothetical protein